MTAVSKESMTTRPSQQAIIKALLYASHLDNSERLEYYSRTAEFDYIGTNPTMEVTTRRA